MWQFKKLLTIDFWFHVDPITLHRADRIFFGVGLVLVLMGLFARIMSLFARNVYSKRVWQRLSNWGLTIGLLEALWFGLRVQHVPTLASHFVAAIILLVGLIWLIPILKYRLGQYYVDIEKHHLDATKQKYLQMPAK